MLYKPPQPPPPLPPCSPPPTPPPPPHARQSVCQSGGSQFLQAESVTSLTSAHGARPPPRSPTIGPDNQPGSRPRQRATAGPAREQHTHTRSAFGGKHSAEILMTGEAKRQAGQVQGGDGQGRPGRRLCQQQRNRYSYSPGKCLY